MGGGPSKATQQQQSEDLQATQQQNSFDKALMSLFSKQYQNQQGVLNYLQGAMKPLISQAEKGQGESPQAVAAMRANATDANAQATQQAQQALNSQEAAQMGGTNILPSGTSAQLRAGIDVAGAQQQAATQNQITQYQASLANSNLLNAANVMNGVASQENPLGYSSGVTGGSGSIAGLSGAQSSLQNSITSANGPSAGAIAGSLGGSLLGAAGSVFRGAGGSLMGANTQDNQAW